MMDQTVFLTGPVAAEMKGDLQWPLVPLSDRIYELGRAYNNNLQSCIQAEMNLESQTESHLVFLSRAFTVVHLRASQGV